MRTKDFDRFMAERGEERMCVRILGRDCMVPRELPWHYMLKVERMLQTGEPIPGEENVALLKHVLKPEDYAYLTAHPGFRASWFWEIIAFAWLRDDATEAPEGPVYRNEDEVKVRQSAPKKRRSAR